MLYWKEGITGLRLIIRHSCGQSSCRIIRIIVRLRSRIDLLRDKSHVFQILPVSNPFSEKSYAMGACFPQYREEGAFRQRPNIQL